MSKNYRVGIGYDAHRLVLDRKLILGGVNIPFEKGLQGHSDADVVLHALIDSILGALGEGDIGQHFPDNDPQYRNISSVVLLEKTTELLPKHGAVIDWIDAIIVTQRPRISPYSHEMRKTIAGVLEIEPSKINIKAKTTEGMGFPGREEGIAAQVITTVSFGE